MNMNNQIKYPVVEQFVSINGEGTKAGELAVFIRFKGCNLKCSYCDTGQTDRIPRRSKRRRQNWWQTCAAQE